SRLLLGGVFACAGLRNLIAAPFLTGLIKARGVPQPCVVLYLGIALQIVAGLLLITGIWTIWAAAALIVFTIAATVMLHNFWDYQGPERVMHINSSLASVAMIGGFLAVIANS